MGKTVDTYLIFGNVSTVLTTRLYSDKLIEFLGLLLAGRIVPGCFFVFLSYIYSPGSLLDLQNFDRKYLVRQLLISTPSFLSREPN